MRFISVPGTDYKVIVEAQGLLWCMTITAPGRTHIRFSNIYNSAADALGEAEGFAAFVLANWGITLDGPIRWETRAFSAAG